MLVIVDLDTSKLLELVQPVVLAVITQLNVVDGAGNDSCDVVLRHTLLLAVALALTLLSVDLALRSYAFLVIFHHNREWLHTKLCKPTFVGLGAL